jgi:hypothetical protein
MRVLFCERRDCRLTCAVEGEMKGLLGWSVLGALVCFPVLAGAEVTESSAGPELGQAGRFAISAERLFGFDYTHETPSMNGVDGATTSSTGFSLFSNPLGVLGGIFSAPRLAVDAFVIPGLSVGAAVGVFHVGQSQTPAGGGAGNDISFTGVVFDPRIGYLGRISPAAAIWPRVGLSLVYASDSTSFQGMSQGSSSSTLLAATLEVPFAFTVVPRVVILFGPTLDYVVYGKNTTNPVGVGTMSTTTDTKETEVGIQAGLLVLL